MAQATIAADALRAAGAADEVVLLPLRTRGDEISRRRPGAGWVASDGQFTSDLERRLAGGEIDAVVHSYKDLPTATDPRLVIGAILERGDPADCLITARGEGMAELRFGARIGTSSARRAAQLAALRPDLIAVPLRGNVESRIERVRRGDLDAVLLAVAGLERLGIDVPPGARLPLDEVLPAPAQAALAIQVRSDDTALLAAVERADHAPTRAAVEAERGLLRAIGGGCLAPLGALGELRGDELRLRAAFETRDGTLVRSDERGTDHAAVVAAVAGALLAEAVPA
jgi:hydroxymethylbilane synthase